MNRRSLIKSIFGLLAGAFAAPTVKATTTQSMSDANDRTTGCFSDLLAEPENVRTATGLMLEVATKKERIVWRQVISTLKEMDARCVVLYDRGSLRHMFPEYEEKDGALSTRQVFYIGLLPSGDASNYFLAMDDYIGLPFAESRYFPGEAERNILNAISAAQHLIRASLV